MPRSSASFWIGSALIAATCLATVAEFLTQRESLGSSSVGMVAALPILIKTGTAALGMYLVCCGWPRQSGRGVHCRSCGYQREEDGRLVPQCPECGAPWRWIGEFRAGERVSQRWKIIVGVSLVLVVIGVWAIRRVAPSLLISWLPTEVLLQQLASFPDEDLVDHWIEFGQRDVPDAKLDDLSEALRRKKLRDGYLSKAADRVIFGAMNRIAQPTAASKQYFSQILSAIARAPESIRLGESFRFNVEAVFQGATVVAQPAPRVEVLAAAYFDGDSKPAQTWIWHPKVESEAQERVFNPVFRPEVAGSHTARVVFWLAIGSPGVGEVEFGDEGPVLPKGMRIYNQFEVTRTVIVHPGTIKTDVPPR